MLAPIYRCEQIVILEHHRHDHPDFTQELPGKLLPTRGKEGQGDAVRRSNFTRRCLWLLGPGPDLKRAHNPKVAGSNPAPHLADHKRDKGLEPKRPNPFVVSIRRDGPVGRERGRRLPHGVPGALRTLVLGFFSRFGQEPELDKVSAELRMAEAAIRAAEAQKSLAATLAAVEHAVARPCSCFRVYRKDFRAAHRPLPGRPLQAVRPPARMVRRNYGVPARAPRLRHARHGFTGEPERV
jgi:hypothetical protein